MKQFMEMLSYLGTVIDVVFYYSAALDHHICALYTQIFNKYWKRVWEILISREQYSKTTVILKPDEDIDGCFPYLLAEEEGVGRILR